MADKIKIGISNDAYNQMYEYAYWANEKQQTEIAGWAHWTKDKGIYKLAPMVKQIASGAEVDAFPSGILNDVKYDMSDMVVQWHSHVNMTTFFSGQDTKNIKDSMELWSMLISIVVNLKGEYTAKLHISGNGRIKFPTVVEMDVELYRYYPTKSFVRDEVYSKLSRPKPPRHKKGNIISFTPSVANDIVINSINHRGKKLDAGYFYTDGIRWCTGSMEVAGERVWGKFDDKEVFHPYDKTRYEKLLEKEKVDAKVEVKDDEKKSPVQMTSTSSAVTGTTKPIDEWDDFDDLFMFEMAGVMQFKPYFKVIVACMKQLELEYPGLFDHEISENGDVIFMHVDKQVRIRLFPNGYLCDEAGQVIVWSAFLQQIALNKFPYRMEDQQNKLLV